jgi:hypothetical protein
MERAVVFNSFRIKMAAAPRTSLAREKGGRSYVIRQSKQDEWGILGFVSQAEDGSEPEPEPEAE